MYVLLVQICSSYQKSLFDETYFSELNLRPWGDGGDAGLKFRWENSGQWVASENRLADASIEKTDCYT